VRLGDFNQVHHDNDAYDLNMDLRQRVELEAPGGELEVIEDWANKLAGQTARIAGLLALFDDPLCRTVSADHVRRAALMYDDLVAHTRIWPDGFPPACHYRFMFESIVFTTVMAAPAPIGDSTPALPPLDEVAIRAAVAEQELIAEKEARKLDQEVAKAHEEELTQKARADTAESARAEEERKAKEAADDLAIEKSAKLLELGITVGAAVATQAPIKAGSTQQQTWGVTALPYVMLLPGFWPANAPVRKYCAAEWSGRSAAAASKAADALAFDMSVLRVAALLETIRVDPDVTHADLRNTGYRFLSELTERQLEAAKEIVALDNVTSDAQKAERKQKLQALQTDAMPTLAGWTPAVKPKYCWARKLGAWVGRPAKYKARLAGSPFDVEFDAKSDIDPVVAFGIGYTPNAYVSVLVGATYATTTLQSDAMDANVTNDAPVWTATVGLGLNADILTVLSGK